MDGLLPFTNDHAGAGARAPDQERGEDAASRASEECEGRQGKGQSWETAGDEYLERLESLAESAVSVDAWRKGLGTLTRKSMTATRKVLGCRVSGVGSGVRGRALVFCTSSLGLRAEGLGLRA